MGFLEAPAMNCADDLTAVDIDEAQPGSLQASSSTSSSSSLFPLIEFHLSHALNVNDAVQDPLKRVLRPLDSKDAVLTNDELVGTEHEAGAGDGGVWTAGCIETQDGDDELLIHVRFSELVRIKSILIGTGGGRLSTSPRLCRAWVNRGPSGITFDEASSATPKPAQEWELLESEGGGRGAVEYPVRIARFANCSDIDLYFANTRNEQSRLFYLGFLGESRVLKKEPGDPMTIGAENAASSMVDGAKEEKRGGTTTSARYASCTTRMPFRPILPAQQPSILSPRSPTSPHPSTSVPTLRLPTAPPVPPKPLYLSTARRIRGDEADEDGRSEGRVRGGKRGALPDRWSVVTADDDSRVSVELGGGCRTREADEKEDKRAAVSGESDADEGTIRFAKSVDAVDKSHGEGGAATTDAPAKSTLAALFDRPEEPASPTPSLPRPRSPSTTSTDSQQTEAFRTPVGTLRAGSTIKVRAKDGRQSIYFDPSSTNPFLPSSATILPDPLSDNTAPPATEVSDVDVVLPSNFPLLPIPSSTSPAIALHAFTGQAEFGELSFLRGEHLLIEIEDVGGGWSLGFVESKGEAKRGLVPRGWYAYVDGQNAPPPLDSELSYNTVQESARFRPASNTITSASSTAGETAGCGSLDVDSPEPYATRSIGRHVVVSGTEFEPTWVAAGDKIGVVEADVEVASDLSVAPEMEVEKVQVPLDDEDPMKRGHVNEVLNATADAISSPQVNAAAMLDEMAAPIRSRPPAVPAPFTQSFLFRIGLGPFFNTSPSSSTLSRFLPALGRTPIPGASILAATSASSSLAAASVSTKPRLPRLETHRASKLPDGRTLLLRWVEEGDELDEVVDYGEHGEGSVQMRGTEEAGGRAEVFVTDPKKCSPLNESPFVVYTVTTSFPTVAAEADDDATPPQTLCVERRYSHFAALHTLLVSRFLAPLIYVPPLPPKGPLAFGAARFDPALLERRRKELERWLRRCLRHPVLGESEEMKSFLATEGEKELSAHLLMSTPRPPPPLQPLFPARVFHPAFNIDLSEAEDVCDRFERHCKAVELGGGVRIVAEAVRMAREQEQAAAATLQQLAHALVQLASGSALPPTAIPSLATGEAGSINEPRTRAKSWSLQNEAGALSWKEDDEPALGVSKAVQAAGEACANIADLGDTTARTGLVDVEEQLLSVCAPFSQHAPLIELHRSLISNYRRLARLSGINPSISDQLAQCETALNITAAEMDRIRLERREDLAEAMRGWLETKISVHEQALDHLRFALDHFSPASLADLALTGPRLRSRLDTADGPLAYPPLPRACVYERNLGSSAWR
ncbi:Sorting nexin lst-4 [Rhodotorula toruloides]|nr:Sorting nexin lst-4 [Rhodotorula toruloides]